MKKLYIAYRQSGGDPISYQEFKEIAMRNILDADGNPDPKKVAIFDLYLTMLSACAGSSTYGEKLRRTTPVSTAFASDGNFAVTCGTEAMTLVMFDNCVDKWDHMYQYKHVDNKPGKLPKYSPKKHDETKQWKTKYSDSCSGNSPYGGWSKEGIREFNKVTKEIQDLRENQADAILEVEKEAVKRFHAVYIVERKRKAQENGLIFDENEDGDGSPGSKRSKSDDDDEEVEAVFDMGNRAV
jgi:hypothetical protein